MEKGMTVRLKSGGPKMTIENIGNYRFYDESGPADQANCVWFDGNEKKECVFDLACLEPYQ